LYLVAEYDGKVVGIIAFGNPSHYITDHIKLNVSIQEIKSVLVAKAFQKCGVGSILFTSIINELNREGYIEFCLDCGYKFSQPFWEKKLGEPTKVLLDFWAKGSHHKIWVKNIQ
jgi:GNAT superfamily N-acetyltransferase